ncbi:MAG: type IIA DNA topoisomerase subunit B [Candidatus Marsarchaeota archaeon]|nr:type IIA DNA topoisomerase subunit B [Candidatus Marsarchaeota archaeon]
MAESDDYNASKIIVLEGPQGIRKRPAMYIGSTGPSGVLHLLYEVIDNAVDEAMSGYCKNIKIRLFMDNDVNVAEVIDDGRGIPVDIMPKFNKSALEVIMTTLHKGGKFSSDAYKVSGGLHGVGLTVVNALSEYTNVTVKKDGHIYRMGFSKGVPTSPLQQLGDTKETGTTTEFKPDKEIFQTTTFDSTTLKDRLRYTSFLNPGINITLKDERFESPEDETYSSKEGITDFIRYMNNGKTTLTNIIRSKIQEGQVSIEYALQYNNTYDEKIESFVNNIRTVEGGTHVVGFHTGLTRAVLNYISKNKSGKAETKISGEDVREGLTAVLSVLMQNPEFEGQTKGKLGNAQIKTIVETEIYSRISRYLEEHPSDAKAIVEKAETAANARESSRKARELARKKSLFEGTVLPGKLADCISNNPDETELFIVEGQSAGGSGKDGRDKNIQAILPLRGKILNVEKANVEKIFDNAEIKALITAFGTGINESFNSENIRYKKIILMTDADVDGSHIRTLLLTFIYRYMRKIIEDGYVYMAQPPLYKVSKGKDVSYCYSDQELDAKLKELGGKAEVQRYKGLGEMNPEQLWETTMDPKNRILKKVSITDAMHTDELFTILMGMDVQKRRKFLQEHAEGIK